MSNICDIENCQTTTSVVPEFWSGTINVGSEFGDTGSGGWVYVTKGTGAVLRFEQDPNLPFFTMDFTDYPSWLDEGGNPYTVQYIDNDEQIYQSNFIDSEGNATTCLTFNVTKGVELDDSITQISMQ